MRFFIWPIVLVSYMLPPFHFFSFLYLCFFLVNMYLFQIMVGIVGHAMWNHVQYSCCVVHELKGIQSCSNVTFHKFSTMLINIHTQTSIFSNQFLHIYHTFILRFYGHIYVYIHTHVDVHELKECNHVSMSHFKSLANSNCSYLEDS